MGTMQLVDTTAAALGTGITPALMRHWIRRGKLTRHGHDYHGRAIVDLNEVEQLKAQLAAHEAANPTWTRAACGKRSGVSH